MCWQYYPVVKSIELIGISVKNLTEFAVITILSLKNDVSVAKFR